MGEVIVGAVIVSLALTAAIVYVVLTRPGADGRDPRAVRNHMAMARILDRIMNDDDVRPLLPSKQQQDITELVSEFYGDKHKGIGR